MKNDTIILHGGGGHAKVVIDALFALKVKVEAVFDPKYTSGEILGIPFRGIYDEGYLPHSKAVIAIGSNHRRKSVAANTKHGFFTVIHPSSIVSSFVKMGQGCMVLHGTIIQIDAVIGDHVIVNTGATIDHDCVIGSFAHIAPQASLCGNVTVGEGALIGAGATVIPGVKIGRWAVIGAGAVVTKDVAEYATAVGNPARVIKVSNPANQN